MKNMSCLTTMNRREMLTRTIAGAAAFTLGGGFMQTFANEPGLSSMKPFADALDTTRKWVTQNTVKSRIEYPGGYSFHTPCVTGHYRGIWPDDFLYPVLVEKSLMTPTSLKEVLEFLSEHMLKLPCVPDRVETDGKAVMRPGRPNNPHGHQMPLHLPAAWVRLLDYFKAMGATIPQKAEWARLIERSFDQVPFKSGLAFVDPKKPYVGFGFHDPCAITGLELMSSLVLYRGFQRAASLFEDVITPELKTRWLAQAQGIKDNLHQLWSEEDGAYFAGSIDCKQVNVWGNGLAYWLSEPEKQQRIISWYKTNRQNIFKSGYTRQIVEKKGWRRQFINVRLGTYTNGGFWSTGTGFVLPAIADQDTTFAAELTKDLVDNMEQTSFAEWIAATGRGNGAKGFLAGIAMPGIGLLSIIEKKPLISYF